MAYAGGIELCMALDHPSLPMHWSGLQVRILPAPQEERMYSVNRVTHEVYGPVVVVDRQENGNQPTPFRAIQRALSERNLWRSEGPKKVRLLVDGKIMSPNQADHWSHEEYKSLPKCKTCAKILDGDVCSHQLCETGLFCSQECADKDYLEEMEKLKDEEEIDYL